METTIMGLYGDYGVYFGVPSWDAFKNVSFIFQSFELLTCVRRGTPFPQIVYRFTHLQLGFGLWQLEFKSQTLNPTVRFKGPVHGGIAGLRAPWRLGG